MLLKVILLIATIAGSHAESTARAPYAPAGWRPRVPFNLPSQNLPPVGSSFEISRERVEHAGAFNAAQANSNYLPPNAAVPNQGDILERERQANQLPSPAAQYGAPVDGSFRIDYPDEENPAPSTDLQSRIEEGRYYIVSSDNKLQRVQYRTVKNAEDAAGAGFTAQLRYSSVGELQDPIYKYNSQGQLERVLK
ncbi:uncharacterized protein [Drosophila virilis]|uniref:DUF4794 domain-containing protein n=1 Tax=Drosophila virilis TaxID=7244 RepID=B4LMT6_DROVI|nr:uncharacterized protein LOC6626770 [Drosophila virilis]EDW61027.1 uncharacterized protein Dvir_GJ20528 [Drosophila virilis]